MIFRLRGEVSHCSLAVGVVTLEKFLGAFCLFECTVGLPFTTGGLFGVLPLIATNLQFQAWKILFLSVWVPAVALLQAEEEAVN